MEKLQTQEISDNEMVFYEKTSNFVHQHTMPIFDINSKQYVLNLAQNEIFTNELAIASTDYSIQVLDINTAQLASMKREHFHTDKIHSLKYSNDSGNEHLQHVIFSASQDRNIKLWDRRNGEGVVALRHQNMPFFSVDCNRQLICGGSNSMIIFWDIRKMKSPLYEYGSSHTDDVTQIRYNKTNPNWMISSSTDNLMCHFDFNGKASLEIEDETMEGVYRSNQPLIDCGYINNDLFWVQTSVNTIEFITVENCDVYAKIEKFPHAATYLIGCELDRFTNKFVVYAGNNQGEVYIYEYIFEAKKLNLVDMILTQDQSIPTGKQEIKDTIIRNKTRISNEVVGLTNEVGEFLLYKYSPLEAQAQQLASRQSLAMVDPELMQDESDQSQRSKKKPRFRPF